MRTEKVNLIVENPVVTHEKPGPNGWQRIMFKAICGDGRRHTVITFDDLMGFEWREVPGILKEEPRKTQAGASYVSRTFYADKTWLAEQKANPKPAPAPVATTWTTTSAPINSGNGNQPKPPSHNEIVSGAKELASRSVNSLIAAGCIKDSAGVVAEFKVILDGFVETIKSIYGRAA